MTSAEATIQEAVRRARVLMMTLSEDEQAAHALLVLAARVEQAEKDLSLIEGVEDSRYLLVEEERDRLRAELIKTQQRREGEREG